MTETPRLDPLLQARLEENDALLQALSRGEVDAVVSDTAVWLLRAQQAESALRASEARFRDLVEGSIQGVIVHRHFRPLFVNSAYATLFGYTLAEILAMGSTLELVAPHERARLQAYDEARLRGAPPGYVGYDEGGQLTEAVRRRPFSVILFDEIEKAHFDVFNLLLQILDDGRLTDGHGRTVDFKNTIVIMTSNVGSHRILEYRGAFEGEAYERMKQAVLEEMRSHFRPEFLNRVDEIIVFHALSEEHLKQIVEIQLGYLRKRLAERHIQIELTDAAREFLVRIGYDPSYGARPLKRAIQKEVETPLARLILKGEVRDGQTVHVDYDPSRKELQFAAQEEAGVAAH
jgi:PAS domain-containing protein